MGKAHGLASPRKGEIGPRKPPGGGHCPDRRRSSLLLPGAPTWSLQAPAQSAAGAGVRRNIRFKSSAELAIGRSAPNLAQRLLRRIAESIVLVTALRERSDAARQCAAIGREIHHRPRPPAQRPGRAIVAALEAHARF